MQKIRNNQHKVAATSSKGNQAKWHIGNEWYKADFLGYEGLSEYIVSDILKHSNVKHFCTYELAKFDVEGELLTGCKSADFLKNGESLITLEKLGRIYKDASVGAYLSSPGLSDDKIDTVLNFLSEINIPKVGEYLTQMVELDALILNEDRHTNNIAFLRTEENLISAPFFDHGAAFLSDMLAHHLDRPIAYHVQRIESKPFSTSFDRQKKLFEDRFGVQLAFKYSKDDLQKALNVASDHYGDDVLMQMEDSVLYQITRYTELGKME